jgi:hypothetical protein
LPDDERGIDRPRSGSSRKASLAGRISNGSRRWRSLALRSLHDRGVTCAQAVG